MQQVVHCEMRRLRGSAGASDAIWMLQPVKFDSPVCSGGAVSRFGPQALYVKDIMQQAYGKAYSHLRRFDGRAVFLTWLTQIAIHEALVRARRRNRYTNMDDENRYHLRLVSAMDSTRDPARLAFARELGALTEWAIDRLPDGSRQVSILRQVEGMSTQAVADALNVSEAVVKTQLSGARAALRRELYDQAESAASNTFRLRDRDAIAWWRRSSPASCESTAADRRARPSRSRTEDN